MWTAIKLVLKGVFKFILPVMLDFVTKFSIKMLKDIYNIIMVVDKLEVPPTEKRKLAFDKIKKYLKEQGKEIPTSLVNLVIELLVRKKIVVSD